MELGQSSSIIGWLAGGQATGGSVMLQWAMSRLMRCIPHALGCSNGVEYTAQLDQNFPRTILSRTIWASVYKALFPFEMERQSLVGSLDLRFIFRPFFVNQASAAI